MVKAAKSQYAPARPRAAVAAANQQLSGVNSYQAPNINGLQFGGS
jgi:hypothetical protein